ncbi:uncharacterized protein LOC135360966 [Latimeria chalumnae]|uniref:uncharacterized protein LOC135360966 n=1 Tax=Latimeria chalumnae TaxID=7897 RepID=UPI00313C17B5
MGSPAVPSQVNAPEKIVEAESPSDPSQEDLIENISEDDSSPEPLRTHSIEEISEDDSSPDPPETILADNTAELEPSHVNSIAISPETPLLHSEAQGEGVHLAETILKDSIMSGKTVPPLVEFLSLMAEMRQIKSSIHITMSEFNERMEQLEERVESRIQSIEDRLNNVVDFLERIFSSQDHRSPAPTTSTVDPSLNPFSACSFRDFTDLERTEGGQRGTFEPASGFGSLEDVPLRHISHEREAEIFQRSEGKPEKYGRYLFSAYISADFYHDWKGKVNFDGSRGKRGLPSNLRAELIGKIQHRFGTLSPIQWKLVREAINEFLRNPRKHLA